MGRSMARNALVRHGLRLQRLEIPITLGVINNYTNGAGLWIINTCVI